MCDKSLSITTSRRHASSRNNHAQRSISNGPNYRGTGFARLLVRETVGQRTLAVEEAPPTSASLGRERDHQSART